MSPRSRWFLALARSYARRRLKKSFHGIWVRGAHHARAAVARGPSIFAFNHVTWWDPFVLVWLDETLQTDARCPMDEVNLKRLPFFGKLGAYPVPPKGDPRRSKVVDVGVEHLKAPGDAMFIFPQGQYTLPHKRPLRLAPGVERMAHLTGADVIPVGLNYVWGDGPKPSVCLSFGPPSLPTVSGIAYDMTLQLDRIDRFAEGHKNDFLPMLHSKAHNPEGGLGTRLLGGQPERTP